MKMTRSFLNIFSLFLFAGLFASASPVAAQTRAYRVSDSQVQTVITRIETRTDSFKNAVNRGLDRSRINNTSTEESVVSYIDEFENATDRMRRNFDARRSVDADIEEVLRRAAFINEFMQRNRLNAVAQREWASIRGDLDTLAGYYDVRWNWMASSRAPANDPRAYRVLDADVLTLLTRIETRSDSFKNAANRSLDRSAINNTRTEESIVSYIDEFENATDRLRRKFDARNSVDADVEEVLSRAAVINQFVTRNRMNAVAQREWNAIRTDLNTLAGYYSVSWNWNGTQSPVMGNVNTGGQVYIASDANVRSLLARLETQTDIYRRELNAALDRSALNDSRSENEIVSYVEEFERATNRLRDNFNGRRSAAADVEEVLSRGAAIDVFMRDYRLGARAEQPWRLIRTDLNTLAGYYRLSTTVPPAYNASRDNFDTRLTGTYRLNSSLSDDATLIVDRALSTSPNRDRQRTNLIRRLTPPQMLAVEVRNRQVTIASDTAPQVTFTADGAARTETNPNGRQVKITAATSSDGVNLSYEGDRVNDFYVNFMPMGNGQLRVVRRLYLEGRNETLTVSSVYDKVDNTARWTMVDNSSVGQTLPGNTNSTVTGDFVIPNNTQLIAVLNTPLSTRTGADGERFTMEVRSPGQYSGAIIEGYVSRGERSGRITGRAELSLNFDRIRLRDGSTYRFTGLIDSVRTVNGDNVTINNEGAVRDSNQTTKTVTRAGIGAALGALIGAIAGGGSGAAVGAAIGAGAGAGTVVLQGRNDLELQSGTEFNITATSPANLRGNR